ncbi:hypothetical protein V2J09_002537 [Rumex salicifolius]
MELLVIEEELVEKLEKKWQYLNSNHLENLAKKVICFDHRKSTLKTIESPEACLEKVKFHVDVERSSSRAVYEYFSSELKQNQKVGSSLLDSKDQERVELLLNYIEDVDLRRWRLTDINAFKIGMGEWRSRMNCITNPFMFDQGNSLIQPCKDAGKNVLDKAFKLRLGKGIYGECLLSLRSSATGLRPIGAVIYIQGNNLKMCLRSVDSSADTSEIAKVCLALDFIHIPEMAINIQQLPLKLFNFLLLIFKQDFGFIF